jgi:hypothetical protein
MSKLEYTPEGYPKDNQKFREEAREVLERNRTGIDQVKKYLKESRAQLERARPKVDRK